MSRYTMCPLCGHRMRRDIEFGWGWNGKYICDYCNRLFADDDDDDDDDDDE